MMMMTTTTGIAMTICFMIDPFLCVMISIIMTIVQSVNYHRFGYKF